MKEHARKALAAKLISDAVKSEGDGAKASVLDDFAAAGLKNGTVDVTDHDGVSLGTAVFTGGRVNASVVDDAALLAWVKANYPNHIVASISKDFRDRLLQVAKAKGEPIDPDTGEIVPGIEVTAGDPYIAMKPTKEGRSRMRDLLAGNPILRLTGGES